MDRLHRHRLMMHEGTGPPDRRVRSAGGRGTPLRRCALRRVRVVIDRVEAMIDELNLVGARRA